MAGVGEGDLGLGLGLGVSLGAGGLAVGLAVPLGLGPPPCCNHPGGGEGGGPGERHGAGGVEPVESETKPSQKLSKQAFGRWGTRGGETPLSANQLPGLTTPHIPAGAGSTPPLGLGGEGHAHTQTNTPSRTHTRTHTQTHARTHTHTGRHSEICWRRKSLENHST